MLDDFTRERQSHLTAVLVYSAVCWRAEWLCGEGEPGGAGYAKGLWAWGRVRC